jgi:hypothetical protein
MQAARVSKRHWSALLILQRSMLDIIDQSVIIVRGQTCIDHPRLINHTGRRKPMKRTLLVAALLAVGLTACGKKEEPKTAPAPTPAPAPAPAPPPETKPAPPPAPGADVKKEEEKK